MNEQQKRLVEMLNDMYHSQDKEYKSYYRNNYFVLLQYIISPGTPISCEETTAPISEIARILKEKAKQKGNE